MLPACAHHKSLMDWVADRLVSVLRQCWPPGTDWNIPPVGNLALFRSSFRGPCKSAVPARPIRRQTGQDIRKCCLPLLWHFRTAACRANARTKALHPPSCRKLSRIASGRRPICSLPRSRRGWPMWCWDWTPMYPCSIMSGISRLWGRTAAAIRRSSRLRNRTSCAAIRWGRIPGRIGAAAVLALLPPRVEPLDPTAAEEEE